MTKTTAGKWRRHNDDNHDKDVENQQPTPHPMPPIILPQAFLHAPNTFKPVCHIGARTSSTVLNLKTWFTACVHVSKLKLYPYTFFLLLYIRTLSQNWSKVGRPS